LIASDHEWKGRRRLWGVCGALKFEAGIVTVLLQVMDPPQVSKMVSPSLADEIAALTVFAEQSDGPTLTVAACARADIASRTTVTRNIFLMASATSSANLFRWRLRSWPKRVQLRGKGKI